MKAAAQRKPAEKYPPIMGGFVPFPALWDGEAGGPPLFPSETSARWFIRVHREALVKAEAIARHAGRMLVHRERFESVARTLALARAR